MVPSLWARSVVTLTRIRYGVVVVDTESDPNTEMASSVLRPSKLYLRISSSTAFGPTTASVNNRMTMMEERWGKAKRTVPRRSSSGGQGGDRILDNLDRNWLDKKTGKARAFGTFSEGALAVAG